MINRFYSWPIRVHLTILIALLAVPSISLIIYSGMAERREAIAGAKAECLKFVNDVAGQQQAIVAGAEQLASALSLLSPLQSRNPAAATTLFSDLVRKNPQYASISVTDKSGFVWASSTPFEGKVSLADRRYFQEAVRTGMFSSGEYLVGRMVKKPIISFGYPVKNAANGLIAVIVVVFDLDYGQRIFEKLNLPLGSSFSLLDRQGIILIRGLKDTFSEKLTGSHDTREELFTKMAEGPVEGTYEAMGNDGNFRLVAYNKISLAHESKPYLYVRSSIPLASATSRANAAMLRNLSVFVSLFFIGLFLAWVIGKRIIVNPVRVLKGAAEQLAAGTDSVHVSHAVKGGEFGELARIFDGMAEALVQRETALREREQRWATTLASIGDAVIATDVEARITFMNAVAEELTGWALSEAVAGPVTQVFNIVNEQTRRKVENPVAKVLEQGNIVGLANHTLLVRRDGTEVPIDDSGAPIRDPNGKTMGVVLVFRDITERKRVDEALKKAHDELERRVQERTAELAKQSRIFEGFFKSTITPLVFLDRNFNYIQVNEAYAKSCQREISKFEGHNHFEFYPHEENEAIFRKVVERKIPYQAIAKPFSFPDHPEWGTTYWDWTLTPLLDDKGEVEFLVFSLEDVTGGKRAELALQETSLYARSLIEASIDPLVTISRNGKIMDVNRATELTTGLSRDALIGSDFSNYFTEPEKAREGYERVFSKGSVSDYPLAIRHTSGRVIEVLYNATIFKNEAGKVQGVFAAARDITERKRAEEALRKALDELQEEMARREKAEQQLLQAQKLESIGTLTGGIAHDFNNILASIAINADLALLDLSAESGPRHNLEMIVKAGQHGSDLVKQMLLFSRKSGKKQAILTLTPLIKETFKLLRSSIPTTIQMELLLETESDAVSVDPSQIQQVIMNLCTNAAYAMRGTTGSIDISLQGVTLGLTDLPEADMQPGDYLVLSVKDTGSGMDEEVRKRIFEPFFSTKPVGEGTGLGLSVVYGIVKNHKGGITVYSEPGKGSIFKVYLPKVDTAPSVAPETPKPIPIPRGNERILVVDDEEFIVKAVQNMLQHLGYKVTARMDSQEALKLFSADPSQFDLVMTDQTMPFMTGEDLGKVLMKIRSDIPVILCTGYNDLISSEKATAMGFQGFIMKPFTVREGAELVRRVLDEKEP